MAIVDALNKVTGGHGSTIEEAVKNLSSGGGIMLVHDVDGTLDRHGRRFTMLSLLVQF